MTVGFEGQKPKLIYCPKYSTYDYYMFEYAGFVHIRKHKYASMRIVKNMQTHTNSHTLTIKKDNFKQTGSTNSPSNKDLQQTVFSFSEQASKQAGR